MKPPDFSRLFTDTVSTDYFDLAFKMTHSFQSSYNIKDQPKYQVRPGKTPVFSE